MTARAYTPTNHELDGLVLGPANPDRLVVSLHGFGANAADLMGIGESLSQALPTTAFIAPEAPGRMPFGPNARFWFALTNELRAEHLDKGVQQTRPLVASYIEAVLHDFDLPAERLVLFGFSQGGMMALEVAPRLPAPLGHVLSFSGALAGEARLEAEVVSRPPIFLGHGTADEVVPFAAMDRARQTLEGAGLSVETRAYQGLGHGISQEGLRQLYETVNALA